MVQSQILKLEYIENLIVTHLDIVNDAANQTLPKVLVQNKNSKFEGKNGGDNQISNQLLSHSTRMP